MKPLIASSSRWLPGLVLVLIWLTLWLSGLWLKPPNPDRAIAVIRVNDVYLDGRRFDCRSLSETMAFDLGCALALPDGTLEVETRANTSPNCTATWAGQSLPCRLRGFGYFRSVAEVIAPADVAARLAPGDVTLVALGLSEQVWLPIGFAILATTSLLVLIAAWSLTRTLPRWRLTSAGALALTILPLNLLIVVVNYAGMAMID